MKYVISFKNKCGENCMTGADTRKDTFHQLQYLKGYGYTILKVEEIKPKLGGKAAWDVTEEFLRMKGRTAHEEIIFKNAQPWVLCPWCSYRFIGDQNNDSYADCPVCGGRIFYDEVYF